MFNWLFNIFKLKEKETVVTQKESIVQDLLNEKQLLLDRIEELVREKQMLLILNEQTKIFVKLSLIEKLEQIEKEAKENWNGAMVNAVQMLKERLK